MFKTGQLHSGLLPGLSRLNNTKGGLAHLDGALESCCVETVNYIQQLANIPSRFWIHALDAMIRGMKTDGDWYALDRMWIFAAEYQDNARVSIVNPVPNGAWPMNITEVNGVAWNSLKGYRGNGANTYLNTNYNPSTNAINYSLNSAGMGVYSILQISSSGFDMGNNGPNASLLGSNISGNAEYIMNSPHTEHLFGNSKSQGLFSTFRTSNVSNILCIDGVVINSQSDVSPGIQSLSFYIGAYNNSGSPSGYSGNQYAMAFLSSASVRIALFYNRIQTFMTTINNNV